MNTERDFLRPTYVEVDLNRLIENLHAIQHKVAPASVMPVIKANAYGHGLVPVAKKLVQENIKILAVAILDEGIVLRKAGISVPILVMGGILPHQIRTYLETDLIFTVSSEDNLTQIDAKADSLGIPAKVHIKIDTGMGRLGVPYSNAEALLRKSLELKNTQVTGIYSHFASSDSIDLDFSRIQLDRFKSVLEFYDREGVPKPVVHMANSGAVLQIAESNFDMVRPGIMLYGVYPSKEVQRTVSVKPVLSLKTHPVLSKVVPPNSPISYGSTWHSDRICRILTLPLGYGDGYFRALSNKGYVLCQGKRYPVVGRVCMDQIMVNVGEDKVDVGDEVVLIGSQKGQQVTVDELADLVGTIGYEILTNINPRVPRLYLGE